VACREKSESDWRAYKKEIVFRALGKMQECDGGYPGRVAVRSTAACLQRSWVQIQPGAWMFVVCCQVEVSAKS
jgi:hypothetical protein